MRMRISRKRAEFGYEGLGLTDRDGGDGNAHDIKPQKQTNMSKFQKRILEIGLQAANKMKTFSSQTYYNRSVNAIVQYEPEDFIN